MNRAQRRGAATAAAPRAAARLATLIAIAWFVDGALASAARGEQVSGREVYARACAVCHGEHGDGNGEAAARLSTPPRDFRSGHYKFRSTASGQLPTDDDLRRSIVRGLRGTAMVPQNQLSDAEVEAVIAYIKGFSPAFAKEPPPHVLKMPQRPEKVPDLARGKKIYHDAGCINCHGATGEGNGEVAKDLSEAPADLTRRPLKGGSSAADILRTVVTGLDGTPMPSYQLLFDDADMWALADYVESLGGKEKMTDEEKLGWEIEQRDPNTGQPLAR